MKIVLLGASGQLGQEWQVFFNKQASADHLLLPYTSSQLDITNEEELAHELEQQEADVVINCAAYTDVDGAEEHRDTALKVNAEAVASLAEICSDLDCMLIHYSTDYVFPGSLDDRDNLPGGYPEDYPTNAINYYGETKLKGEEGIRSSGCRHLIVRVSWLCGAYGANFVKTMLMLGRERDQLQVVNDQWGSPAFTENVVFNTWQLLEAGQSGTYHITSKGLITWYDFARATFEAASVNVEVQPVSSDQFPTAAKRPHFSKLNTNKVKAVAGTKVIDWKLGLKSMLEELESQAKEG
ncbi:dTDP-4-dehydrorhamnose reductase [Fodinibius salsisoli]|uniref:dTDP-4-dehydrorhamnose reductase n=1 Tax=Fodinibius salsisoli TaxID=2820877 RepID=A0ABT3PIY3_9BACT|nr:dTDP-4-dehydrorhamnose reductase [Fodinibius salsisoli]MCW9705905.1 dTDP-4-dehydrorhamnose reductase [Fodinibius salsisoli]